jgi:thiol-disulfide isomerase/thioredoxin
MEKLVTRSLTAALLVCLIGSAAPAAADRSAREILKDLDAIKSPSYDPSRRAEPGYIDKVRAEFTAFAEKRDPLILELLKADPDHDRLPELMSEHWRRMPPIGPNEAKLNQEITDVLARSKNEKLKTEAYFARAQAGLFKSRQTGTLDLAGVEEFLQKAPKDPRAAQLLYMATVVSRDEKAKTSLEDRLLKDFPDSQFAGDLKGARRQRDALGKPFELEFTDAISGSNVSIKNLKGKVVVIDFWATWCGPCVKEMPHMKELYAKYHDQGVEFIGVSLDQSKEDGGLDSLKNFVKQNGIRWPQYYQGKYWDSEFSRSWGILAIPAVFVVDTEGKLYSVQARGKLDKMIPELLSKKGEGPKAPTGGD